MADEASVAADSIFYVYEGVHYDSLEALVAAADAGAPEEPQQLTSEVVVKMVRGLFQQYAGADKALTAHEFKGLAASVAVALSMDPRRFGDLSATFDRFDVNGDGLLVEEECVMLAESMLRYYLAAVASPRSPTRVGMLNLEVKRLEDHFELLDELGEGGQGIVYLARERATGDQRAVKCCDKRNANAPLQEIEEEFRLLRALDHPKIQRLYDIFEDRSYVYVISEPYYGGHLGDLIENAYEHGVSVTSVYLAKALHQVLQGVVYLHSKYVTHCDLKESNLMIPASLEDWREPSVVVIDFGLAHNFVARGSSGGTPGYMPPEVWTTGLWTPKGDVHALGVVIFQLFSNGEKCFPVRGDKALEHAAIHVTPDLGVIRKSWRRCTDLLPLLEKMLGKDPRARPTASECMEDVFFQKRVLPDPEEDYAEEAVTPEVMSALGELGERSKLQKAILTDIASKLNLAELRELNDAFNAMDADHNGVLTAAEVRRALQGSMDAESLEQAIERLAGPDGQVPYTTFMGQMLTVKEADESRLVWREFQRLDLENNGYLDMNEVEQLLEQPALAQVRAGTRRSAVELMALMDADGDGRVVFEEFRRAVGVRRTPQACPPPPEPPARTDETASLDSEPLRGLW